MKKILTLLLFVVTSTIVSAQTFTNPLTVSGADPWNTYKDGYYYYTQTTGRNLAIWRTKDLTDLRNAEKKVIWTPPPGQTYSKEIWAPELHFLKGKWYMYFAADAGKNEDHRMYVVENPSADPMQGEWIYKGMVADETNKWAIDATIFENRGKMYMLWSGWEGDKNGMQSIYIAEMSNPWTISSKRTRISSPQYAWENNSGIGVVVNEGPQMLKHGNNLHIIYSASGCWTQYYALGMLTAPVKGNLLDSATWVKSPEPVFQQNPANSIYAPGHNSFFKSPDGTEDWILYHANINPNDGCGNKRAPRAQKFTWRKDGTPDFGVPLKDGVELKKPSGTR
ncbi:glycoside hydrolase family 43 protein [Mucilaginibacter myungsuensis]|uniref:Glycoside hydrolase family 43 protein n=1 Tax=Mucilaginibacter myungsuensis TaxID=649104 RepID=A0A929KVK3_9SPHI|nr:glycoside hydrolase family 43 protein [Mucilaginibacter myungsuensis]MBE9661532.1 glycoside hydrolase family 43 protein [Mucilaginibacter myungsuensis]MDN3597675.1 glycoside hydrolase family 43 protein [Mucilaginibacter myungsuensis]